MREKRFPYMITIRLTEQQYTILSLLPGEMPEKCRQLISKGLKELISAPLM